MTVQVFGYQPRARSWICAILLLAVGGLWLVFPLLWSRWAPDRAQADVEAPLVLLVQTLLIIALAYATWLDSRRDSWPLGIAVVVVLTNLVLRETLNAGHGIEANYVLPFLAGAAGGLPMGTLVGAMSCLASQFALNLVSPPLPGQLFVWALAGAIGGLARPLSRVPAWLVTVVLGAAFGPLSGLALNLTFWTTQPRPDTTSFFPGLPPWFLLSRLWQFTRETSWKLDLTRGISTAIGIFVIGYWLLPALRAAWRPDPGAPPPRPPDLPDEQAVHRRSTASHLDDLWNKEQT